MRSEIEFVVEEDPDAGFTARSLGEGIYTQADDMMALRKAVRDAVRCHFPSVNVRPRVIRLHLVRD